MSSLSRRDRRVWLATPLCFFFFSFLFLWGDQFGKKEIGRHLKMYENWNKCSNTFLCSFLECVRLCVEDASMCLMDFVLLGSK